MVTPKSEDGLLSEEERYKIRQAVYEEFAKGYPEPNTEHLINQIVAIQDRSIQAQRDLTASIKDASCQARVERILRGIEQAYKMYRYALIKGGRKEDTFDIWIGGEWWQAIKKREGI